MNAQVIPRNDSSTQFYSLFNSDPPDSWLSKWLFKYDFILERQTNTIRIIPTRYEQSEASQYSHKQMIPEVLTDESEGKRNQQSTHRSNRWINTGDLSAAYVRKLVSHTMVYESERVPCNRWAICQKPTHSRGSCTVEYYLGPFVHLNPAGDAP